MIKFEIVVCPAARLVKSLEQETLNLRVVGSNHTLGVFFFLWSVVFLCNSTGKVKQFVKIHDFVYFILLSVIKYPNVRQPLQRNKTVLKYWCEMCLLKQQEKNSKNCSGKYLVLLK